VCTDPKAAIKTAPNSKANHAFVDRQTKREMVSTGDNNGGTPPAEAMPEAVREAAMKVAAWLNGTASKAEGEGVAEPAAAAYTVPAPEQLTRDVLNALVLGFQQRDNAAHAAPTLTEDHNLQHDDGISRAIATVGYEQLKAAKHAAILNIEAAIARATDPESQAELKELLERVKDAKSSGGLRDVLASASTAVANAISRAKEENSQQKIDKLWGEVREIEEKADKILDRVALNDEEKTNRKKIDKDIEEARKADDKEKLRKAYEEKVLFLERIGEKYHEPELIEASKRLKAKTTQISTEQSANTIAEQSKSAHKESKTNQEFAKITVPVTSTAIVAGDSSASQVELSIVPNKSASSKDMGQPF
jgi:hypothetical protein